MDLLLYEFTTPLDQYATRYRLLCDPEAQRPSPLYPDWPTQRHRMCMVTVGQSNNSAQQLLKCLASVVLGTCCVLAMFFDQTGLHSNEIQRNSPNMNADDDLIAVRDRIVAMRTSGWNLRDFKDHVKHHRLSYMGVEYVVAGVVSLNTARAYNDLRSLQERWTSLGDMERLWEHFYDTIFTPDVPLPHLEHSDDSEPKVKVD